MELVGYQASIADHIYKLLTQDDDNRGITLCGDTGSGRSTIALGVAGMLREGWSVFYINGIDPNLSPYFTWHIGMKLYSKRKSNLTTNVSFGINFFPVPISLEFGNLSATRDNFVMTPSEEALVAGIKKQSAANQNILIIADDYELWDDPSKSFLKKLLLPELGLLPGIHLTILLIAHNRTKIEGRYPWNFTDTANLTKDDIHSVLRQCGYMSGINMEDVDLYAGNDLSVALMAAEYYEKSGCLCSNFAEIMDKRYNDLSEENREACRVLEPLSIIDSYFTNDEAAFFLDSAGQDELEKKYRAEQYLEIAENQQLIVGEYNYNFINSKIREYFRTKLSKKERLCHRKFADYLQKCRPEDYYSRGKHLTQGIQANDPHLVRMAWQLLFLAYLRRSSETSSPKDIYRIFPDINALINRLTPDFLVTQKYTLKELLSGYVKFSKYQYHDALCHLQAITTSQLIPPCLAEVQRMILLCHIQLAENPIAIQQKARELYDTIEDNAFQEDEQYCRAAMVLLDVYVDRSNDEQRVNTLRRKLPQVIHRHAGQAVFEEIEACHNRKAALYYDAMVARRQTEQSVQFYRTHNNQKGLYMALCNHVGNEIIAGDYQTARQALSECVELLNHNSVWYHPSRYKIENNEVLLNYLLDEIRASDDRASLLTAASKATESFERLLDRQEDEVSHVVLFNYLGLSMLCGKPSWREKLKMAKKQLNETDRYYQYFLHDLAFADALLQNDLDSARNELMLLKRIEVPLLQPYNPIFCVRRQEQEFLLNDSTQVHGDAVTYHQLITAACSHIQCPSCYFYGRGFLLSDLQFLSL